MLREIIQHLGRDTCIGGRLGVVIFVVAVDGEQIGTFTRHADEKRFAID